MTPTAGPYVPVIGLVFLPEGWFVPWFVILPETVLNRVNRPLRMVAVDPRPGESLP
jgi:hypothetical protein